MIQISYNEFKQIKRRWIMAESHTRKYCTEKVFLFLFEKNTLMKGTEICVSI